MALLPLVLLAAASSSVDHPKTFLLSIVALPVRRDEMIESFDFQTWGVTFKQVCRIPSGWTIKAGGSLTPEGTFGGQGSLGVSMPRSASPAVFRSLVLIDLYDRVQRQDVKSPRNNGEVPATFKGSVMLSDGDSERKVALNYRNLRLVPARSCTR